VEEDVPRLLLVEDDEGDALILERMLRDLEGNPYALDRVSTPDEALPAMARNEHAVYLVDYLLGADNGLDLLREARARGCRGPFIVLTGQGHYEADLEAMRAGASDYLVKGQFGSALLERSIRYAMERSRMLLALEESRESASRHQEELAHVARLNTLGEMATGLAHELNQPLAAIVNWVQGSRRRIEAQGVVDEEIFTALDRAVAEARRAGAVLSRIRGLVRKAPPIRVRSSLNDIVTGSMTLLDSELRRCATPLELDLEPGLPQVRIDVVQIEQVLLNLAKNALESLEAVEPSRRHLRVRTRSSGFTDIEILVSDTGPGVAEDSRERIFEQFFTTKKSGLGMGLAICRSIIESQGGRLWCAPSDEGATFVFTLPVSQDREATHV